MFHRQTRIYSRKKRSAFLVPTVIILLVSILAALGGTFYWDKMQKEQVASQLQAKLDEQSPKETPSQLPTAEADPEKASVSLPARSTDATTDTAAEDKANADKAPADKAAADKPATDKAVSGEPSTPLNAPTLVAEGNKVDPSYFDDAAFVGDSITQGVSIYDIMPNAKVIAAIGINLDTVFKDDQIRTKEGNKSVLSVLAESNPKKIYVMFGANGVGWFTKEHFSETYGKFVDSLLEQHPDSEIYLQSILPVTKEYAAKDNEIDNSKIDSYNQLVADVADKKQVHYLDVASVFKDANGALPDDSGGDGMHFSLEYYTKWFDYLKTHTAPPA